MCVSPPFSEAENEDMAPRRREVVLSKVVWWLSGPSTDPTLHHHADKGNWGKVACLVPEICSTRIINFQVSDFCWRHCTVSLRKTSDKQTKLRHNAKILIRTSTLAFVPLKVNWWMHQLMLGEYIRNYLALFRDPKQNKWLALILILQKILLSEHQWKLALCTAFSRSIMGRQKGLPSGSLKHMWGSQLLHRLCQDRTGWSCGRDSGNRAQEMPREKAGFLRKVTGGKLHQS